MMKRRAEASEAVSATAKSSVTWRSVAAAKTARTVIAEGLSAAAAHLTACLFVAKEVELIDNMQHHVAGDGVILRVAALHGRDTAAQVRLFSQYIVELQGEGERLAFEQ